MSKTNAAWKVHIFFLNSRALDLQHSAESLTTSQENKKNIGNIPRWCLLQW